jgi:hypothetical protein
VATNRSRTGGARKVIPEDEAGSPPRTTTPNRRRRSLEPLPPSTERSTLVKKSIWITLIALVLLLVAMCGWAVDGARWVATRRPRLAPAA